MRSFHGVLVMSLLTWLWGCRHVDNRDPNKNVKPARDEREQDPEDQENKDSWRGCEAARVSGGSKGAVLLDAPQDNATVLVSLSEDQLLQLLDLLQDDDGMLWLRVTTQDQTLSGWMRANGHKCAKLTSDDSPGDSAACEQVTEPYHFAWPVPNYPAIGRSYGVAIEYQECGFHTGIDIAAPEGKPIKAVAQGKVVHVGPMWYDRAGAGRGPYAVIIEHQRGKMYSTYGHNRRALVSRGQCVTKGQVIAEIGSLGYSTGPHLHFELVMNRPFTGNWQVPFADVCVKRAPFAPNSGYRSPDPKALSYDPY